MGKIHEIASEWKDLDSIDVPELNFPSSPVGAEVEDPARGRIPARLRRLLRLGDKKDMPSKNYSSKIAKGIQNTSRTFVRRIVLSGTTRALGAAAVAISRMDNTLSAVDDERKGVANFAARLLIDRSKVSDVENRKIINNSYNFLQSMIRQEILIRQQ